MIPDSIRNSEFFQKFRDLLQELADVSEPEFHNKWISVERRFDKEWLQQTSKFNVDSWLVQCASQEFQSLKLFKRDKVQKLFFECNDYLRKVGDYVTIKNGPLAGRAKVTSRCLTPRGGLLLSLKYNFWKTRQWEFFD